MKTTYYTPDEPRLDSPPAYTSINETWVEESPSHWVRRRRWVPFAEPEQIPHYGAGPVQHQPDLDDYVPLHVLRRRRVPFPEPPDQAIRPFLPWGPDTLRWYLSGAASDGGAQTNQAASLGNYRSSTEAERCGVLYVTPVTSLSLVLASGSNLVNDLSGSNVGAFQAASADEVAFAAEGSTAAGDLVELSDGDTRTLFDGTVPSRFIRVTRTSATSMAGGGMLEFHPIFNNVFAMSDAAEAESSAGGSRYRAVMARCEDNTRSIKLYLGTLGTAAVSSAGQLGSSGSGTISGATDAFCDWPTTGWCRIVTSGGTLREIVYYSSRTDTTLTVPAAGRARLGTIAAAGAADDTCYAVPGVRIAHEAPAPLAGGNIQTIANESTAPTGVTWSTAISASAGINVGDLGANEQLGLWIHRELPAGVDASPRHRTVIKVEYVVNGQTYTESLIGLYRIADDDLDRYELHIGVNAEPDITAAPTETFTSLPHTTTATLTSGATHYLVVNKRNKYGMRSQSNRSTIIKLTGTLEARLGPSAPQFITLTASASGTFKTTAFYNAAKDGDDAANQWLVYFTSDGSTPTPGVTTPVVIDMAIVNGVAYLDYTTATFGGGTTGKVLVRVRRYEDASDSTNSSVLTATADTTGPSATTGDAFLRGLAQP